MKIMLFLLFFTQIIGVLSLNDLLIENSNITVSKYKNNYFIILENAPFDKVEYSNKCYQQIDNKIDCTFIDIYNNCIICHFIETTINEKKNIWTIKAFLNYISDNYLIIPIEYGILEEIITKENFTIIILN